MRASNNNLTILSEASKPLCMRSPDLMMFSARTISISPEEQVLCTAVIIYQPKSIVPFQMQVTSRLNIGSFHLNGTRYRKTSDFIMQEYFPEQQFHPTPISKHQYYAQCTVITAHFGYQSWSKEFEPLLTAQAQQILRRDVSPQFIVIELLAFMQKKRKSCPDIPLCK